MSFRLPEGSKRARGYGVLAFVVTFFISVALVRDATFGLVCASTFAVVVFEWLAVQDARTDSERKPEIAAAEEHPGE